MNLKKEISKLEREIQEDISGVERWVIERKKFFIKLGWIAGFLASVLVLNYFMQRY